MFYLRVNYFYSIIMYIAIVASFNNVNWSWGSFIESLYFQQYLRIKFSDFFSGYLKE